MLSLIALLLLAAAGYSVGTLTLGWSSPLDAWAAKRHACDTTAVKAAPQPVDIRVFNASKRAGLAGRTARKLKKRGFAIVQVANDSDGPRHGKQVRIRYSGNSKPQALTLASQFRSVDMKKVSGDDDVVDVVLGGKFTKLRRSRAVKAELKTPRPLPCNSATSNSPTATSSASPTGTPRSDRSPKPAGSPSGH